MAICLIATLTQGAAPPKKAMRESVTLPADNNLRKQFGAIDEYLGEKKWVEAIDVLQQIVQTDGSKLVEAQKGFAGETSEWPITSGSMTLRRLPSGASTRCT